jgi:DNA-binding NarL/FixJ family response regulator
MERKITVHIADDHQILIDGVKAVLKIEPNIEVIGFSLNGMEVVSWFQENEADVLILDINMPELDGIEVLKRLKDFKKRPEIIVLSSYDDVKLVKEVLQMGAKGFVPKKSAGEHIVNAVNKVAEGNQYFTDDVKEKMMQTLLNGQVKN